MHDADLSEAKLEPLIFLEEDEMRTPKVHKAKWRQIRSSPAQAIQMKTKCNRVVHEYDAEWNWVFVTCKQCLKLDPKTKARGR